MFSSSRLGIEGSDKANKLGGQRGGYGTSAELP